VSLVPTATPGTIAEVVPTRRWLLPKGSFIDCTLETAIDSTLPGMTSCVTAVDTFGADGRVVLLERGTKLIGETRAEVRTGQRRVFVLWHEARTPTGVVASLASPGTDALGRTGVTGQVDTHFSERFGAALLLSVIDSAATALASSRQSSDATVIVTPQGSQDVISEVVRQSADILPTIRVAQGARIQVFVARNIDFRGVYALKARER
jgi:type IV secretion system protein VirB10